MSLHLHLVRAEPLLLHILFGWKMRMVFNKPVNVKQRSQLTLANVSVALQRRHDYVQQDDSVAGGTDYFIEALLPAEFEFK